VLGRYASRLRRRYVVSLSHLALSSATDKKRNMVQVSVGSHNTSKTSLSKSRRSEWNIERRGKEKSRTGARRVKLDHRGNVRWRRRRRRSLSRAEIISLPFFTFSPPFLFIVFTSLFFSLSFLHHPPSRNNEKTSISLSSLEIRERWWTQIREEELQRKYYYFQGG